MSAKRKDSLLIRLLIDFYAEPLRAPVTVSALLRKVAPLVIKKALLMYIFFLEISPAFHSFLSY